MCDSADVGQAVGSLAYYMITTITKPENKQMNGSILSTKTASVQHILRQHIKVAMVSHSKS